MQYQCSFQRSITEKRLSQDHVSRSDFFQTSIYSIFLFSQKYGKCLKKPTRKTCFSHEMKRLALRIYLAKFFLDDISFILTKFLLYFYKKGMLKRGRLYQKFQERNLQRKVMAYLVAVKIFRSTEITFEVIMHVDKHICEQLLCTYNHLAVKVIKVSK